MAQQTYSEIENLLSWRKPFMGNTMHADTDSDGIYRIYSYHLEIAAVDPGGHVLSFNNTKQSMTTSRHQNLAARMLGAQVPERCIYKFD